MYTPLKTNLVQISYFMTENDFARAAKRIGCDVACIKAVNNVEAPRGAFDDQGRLTILFEPHIFWKSLRKVGFTLPQLEKLKVKHPRLLNPVWDATLYGKFSEQWPKWEVAKTIHIEAAARSASYGAFQILGENHAMLGFVSAMDMVASFAQSEGAQLDGFTQFVLSAGLDDELRALDWAGFARGYNGPGYWKNQYDKKLAEAYKKFKISLAVLDAPVSINTGKKPLVAAAKKPA
jgi:hypothetical protein